jgi:hypothetical protein
MVKKEVRHFCLYEWRNQQDRFPLSARIGQVSVFDFD